jgi:hypothetical protein
MRFPDGPALGFSTQSPMWPVAGGMALMPEPPLTWPKQPLAVALHGIVRGASKLGRTRNSTTSRMASHGTNAAIIAGMPRRSSSPASTANPKAHRM